MTSADVSNIPHIADDRDFSECIIACDKLLTVKGRDYTQGASDTARDDVGRLKNFFRNAERLGLQPRQVLGVYMNKHLDAIDTYIQRGQVESEPIEGRIQDAINYLLLLFKMVRVEQRAGVKEFFDAKNPQDRCTCIAVSGDDRKCELHGNGAVMAVSR